MKITRAFSMNSGTHPVLAERLQRAPKPQSRSWKSSRILRAGPGVSDETSGSSVGPRKRGCSGPAVCLAPWGH